MASTAIERYELGEFEPGDPGLIQLIAPGLEKARSIKGMARRALDSALAVTELVRPSFYKSPDKSEPD